MHISIDEPNEGKPVDPLCFLIRGWLWAEVDHFRVAAIEAWDGEELLGETAAFYPRPDVSQKFGIHAETKTAFEFFGHHSGPVVDREFQLRVRWRDGSRSEPLASQKLRTIFRDYRSYPFGQLLRNHFAEIPHRANIYAEGPSQLHGSPELAALIRRHLGPPPLKIVDVGCGLGYYGRELLADGYDWLGVEVDDADCQELARMNLPHRHVDGGKMPFTDGEFDAGLCIEVFEHIPDLRGFVAEVSRVAHRKLIVSVPNCELLAYFGPHLAVPWHLLEPDHKNFFTRWNLRALLSDFYSHVEVQVYGQVPLRTVEGTPLHYHILAVATNEPKVATRSEEPKAALPSEPPPPPPTPPPPKPAASRPSRKPKNRGGR